MKKPTMLILLLAACASAFALPTLSDLFPNMSEEIVNRLVSGETLDAFSSEGKSTYEIAPIGSQGEELAKNADEKTTGFAVAGLSFIPYPESFAIMTEEERRVATYNILRSISTLKGTLYISHLAGDKPVVLFEDSYILSNPNKLNSKLPDPVATTVPKMYSCFAYQKDNRFGKNVYKITYNIEDGDFLMNIQNYTKMKYMGISCVKERELNMYLEVIQTEEGFILYTMAMADREPQVKVLFITVDLPSAFMRRTNALRDWFEMRVNQ